MDVNVRSPLQRVGCGFCGWGCLFPVLLLAVRFIPLDLAVLLGLPYVAYLLVRLIVAAWVRASMFRTAGHTLGARIDTDTAEGPPPDHSLRFHEYSAASELRLEPGLAALLREAADIGRESWLNFKRAVTLILILLFCVASVWTGLLPFGVWGEGGIIWIVWAFATVQVGLLFVVTRTTYSVLQRVPAGFLVFCLAAGVLGVGWVLLLARWGAIAYGAAIAAGVLLSVRGYRRLRRRLRDRVNHALLILRVFGADENTAHTFGESARRWRLLGSVATIADSSYIRFQGSLASRANRRFLGMSVVAYLVWILTAALLGGFLVNLFAGLQWSAVSNALGWTGRAELVGVSCLAIAGVALLLHARIQTRKNFSGTLAQLQPRSETTAPEDSAVNWDGVFRQSALYCHDDVWRPAVAALLPTAHTVLMDLRGFGAERKGCEYELGLLIDTFPIDRILLITDREADRSALFSMLQSRWSQMKADSPNRKLQEPVISVFGCGADDPDDIERILLLLASRLPAIPSQAGPPVLLPAAQVPRKPRQKWSEALGRMDLRVSQPVVAVWLTAAFLILLLYKTYQYSRSASDAYRIFAAPRMYPVAALAETSPTASEPASKPATPLAVLGHVWTNKPVLDANAGRLTESLDLCLRFTGEPVASASRISGIEQLTMLGARGETIKTANVEPRPARDLEAESSSRARRRWPNDLKDRPAVISGRRDLCVTAYPQSVPSRISEVKGTIALESFSFQHRILLKGLDSLLPNRGWVRLANPELQAVGNVDFIRFGKKDDIVIQYTGDLSGCEIHVQVPNGHEPSFASSGTRQATRKTVNNQTVQARDAADAVIEIRFAAPRRESVAFALSDLPVVVPARSKLSRKLDFLRGLAYEGQTE